MRGYGNVARKEFLHVLRDPTSLVIALLIPLVQMTLFGFAIDFDVRHISTVVCDMDRSRESRQYLDRLRATQTLEIVRMASTAEEAYHSIVSGEAKVAVIVPPDFARRSVSGSSPSVSALVDGSDNIVATRARMAFMRPAAAGPEQPDVRTRIVFNPDMRSQTFMIPGLIAVILQIVAVALTAFSFVRERELGTLEQLMVSPVGRLGLMFGKLTPYALLAFAEMLIVLVVGRLVFDVRVAGGVALLLAMSLPFICAALAMGLVISTIAQNQSQALQLTILTMLPSILMSGFVFPRETMPGPLFLLSEALPVTHFLQIIRGVVVRGAGLGDLWPSAGALLLITGILVGAASAHFRKTLA